LPPYVADFCCEEARLIVEIDGGQHDEAGEADRARTEFFERRGYRVIRFWNTDVLGNVDGVREEVAKCLASPSP
jgi:adenine-specific DNA-methyltransferase